VWARSYIYQRFAVQVPYKTIQAFRSFSSQSSYLHQFRRTRFQSANLRGTLHVLFQQAGVPALSDFTLFFTEPILTLLANPDEASGWLPPSAGSWKLKVKGLNCDLLSLLSCWSCSPPRHHFQSVVRYGRPNFRRSLPNIDRLAECLAHW